MRITLDIDDQVLALAEEFARQQGKSVAQVVSELARKALEAPDTPADVPQYKNGIRVFRARPGALPMTLEQINRIRDEEY
jgi:hypothetical protein